MCVLIHSLRKRHVRRAEVQEAMRSNSAGFFMAILTGKTVKDRQTLRTLDEKEALAFFDKAPDDAEFVMHARIPSYGPKNLDNVHGWEEDGIIFGHNMSLRNLDGFRDRFDDWKSRTDSEFFFRKLFIPYYRGLGKDAYRDGKMHPDLHRFVDWICGTGNRFLFVMPDNKVIRFGTWVNEPDRKEGGEIAFWASNGSYKVFERSRPAYGSMVGGRPQSGGTFPREPDYDECEWGYDSFGGRSAWGSPPGTQSAVKPSGGRDPWDEDEGQTLRDLVGDAKVLRCALANLVVRNLVETRSAVADEIPGESLAARELERLTPDAFNGETYDLASGGLGYVDPGMGSDCVDIYAQEFAAAFQKSLVRAVNNGTLPAFVGVKWVSDGLWKFERQLSAFMRLANLSFDWKAGSDGFATAFYLTRTRTGRPKMEELDVADLIVDADAAFGDTAEAIDIVLETARAEEAEDDRTAAEAAEARKGADKANGKGAEK